MKEKKDRGMTTSIWISQEILKDMDEVAEMASLTRSKLIQNMVEVGIDEIELFQKIGIVKLSLISLELRKQWQKTLSDIRSGNIEKKKRIADRNINVSIWIDSSILEKVEAVAEKMGMSRSQLIEKLVEFGILDLRHLRTLGVLRAIIPIRDLHDRWKQRFKESEDALDEGTLKLNGGDKGT